jgi:SNF2 family DNA or RNA helicase
MQKESFMKAPQLTKRHLLHQFDSRTYTRGFEYYRQKRVAKFDLYESGESLWLIRSKVQGNRLYKQHIELGYSRRGELWIEAECDCPVGYNCKHCAAVLFYAMKEYDRDPHTEWLKTFMQIHKKREKLPVKPDTENFLIVRLYRDKMNDFDFCKARMLKNGTVSKGTKISAENIFYYAHNAYHYDYLTDEDRVLIAKLSHTRTATYYTAECRFKNEYGALMLKALAQSGKCYYKESTTPLVFDTKVKTLTFRWEEREGEYTLISNLQPNEELIPHTIPPLCIDFENHRLYEVDTSYNEEELICLFHAPKMSSEAVTQVTKQVLDMLPGLDFPLPETIKEEKVETEPSVSLHLSASNASGTQVHGMALNFLYDTHRFNAIPFLKEERKVEAERILCVMRDSEREVACREAIERLGFVYDEMSKKYISPREEGQQEAIERWRLFLEETLPSLEEEGWQIEIDPTFNYRFAYADAVTIESVQAEEVNPWFELTFKVEVGGRSIALLPVVSSLLEQYDSIEMLPEKLNLEFEDGEYLHIRSEEITPILQTIFELFDKKEGENLLIKPYDAHLLALDENSPVVWKGGKELKALSQKLKNFRQIEPVTPPEALQAELREYQQFGLDWLHFLHTFKFAGILADDMGLGKTVQTLALLQSLKSKGELEGPTLIIMPTSLIGNWKSEIRKFTPELSYLELYGLDRAEKFAAIHMHDIILTTYQLAQRDMEKYQKERFFYIILDEAQKIKNPKTKMAQAIKSFTAMHKLALSGTPIENHLGELWSIFDFLMPGFLDNLSLFKELYQTPIEKENDLTRREWLNRKVSPFILRRTKEEVVLELPKKTEIVKRALFGQKQAALYENIRVAMEKKVREAISHKGLSKSHITILDALLKLRQVCCHPKLLKMESSKKVTESAKLELFIELIDELHEEGRKVLVFSQFTSMLRILEEVIKKRKYAYTKLTGATRKREEAIEKFTQGNAEIFLISLKAGGVGLNLVAADTVIHYDPWWNPAVENQATDRAYRIGQDKPVFVYKLIVENSIEEQILKLQEKKKTLQNSIYKSKENREERFTGEELAALLKL